MSKVPLKLWNQPHWELKGPDSAQFFRHLFEALPTASAIFIEGTSIAHDVAGFLGSVAEQGDYLPDRQTHWPRPKQYRLRFDAPTLTRLADLAAAHAEPELMDHLFIYQGSAVLLEYPDAFARESPVLISLGTNEQRIHDFAKMLGLNVILVKPIDPR